MIIIGITGTIGAGKGTIVDYLLQKYHFRHYSVRNFLIEEATRRGMPLNRDTYVVVANDLREKNSPSFIIDELYNMAEQHGENAIIESIRTPGEIESLRKKKNFVLLAVDADPKIRYERIASRASETDHISFETFLENEQREMTSTNPNKQNLGVCIQKSDFQINNDNDLLKLYENIENIVTQITKNLE